MGNHLYRDICAWSLPLSCHYSLVLVDRLVIRASEEIGTPTDRKLQWALGALPSGEFEIAGVWAGTAWHRYAWPEVFENLKSRGVEKIRFVLADESATVQAALDAAYPGATLMPSVRQGETLSAIPSHYRSSVRAGADVMQMLKRRANRAVSRHGCFSSHADATAFVRDALERAERSIGSWESPEIRSRSKSLMQAWTTEGLEALR